MKKITLFNCLTFLAINLWGQYNFSGTLQDQQGQAIAYASVLLLEPNDSSFIVGATSNVEGEFTMSYSEKGKVLLAVQMIGYENYYQILSGQKSNLVTIVLIENTTLLKGVEVIAERSSLESDLGKRVFYVGKDLISSGGELSDVLSNFPSVEVNTEGVINVRGSNNVVIYINGKESKRDGRSLTNLPASLIQKVELITNPSAKYDAEGVAGILNIVYRKNRMDNFNATINANIAVPFRWQLGLSGNYKKERVNLFLNTNYTRSNAESKYQSVQQNFDAERRFNNQQTTQNIYTVTSVNTGLEWNMDSTSQWSLEASYFRWTGTENIEFSNQLNRETPIALKNYFAELENEFEVTMNYQKKFRQEDHQLNFALTFEGENEDNTQDFNLDRVDLSNTALQNFIRSSDVVEQQRLWESKLDYQFTLGQLGLLELGWKGNRIHYDILQTIDFEGSNFEQADNDFEVTQWKNAIYAVVTKDWEALQMGIGARVEHFQSDAIQYSLDSSFQNQTLRLFPSFQVNYEISDNQNIGFTYSKRISRPGFFDLNPFIWYNDPLNLNTGNPFLEAELADALELSHEWTLPNFQITTTLFRRNTMGSIQEIIRLEGQQSIISPVNFTNSIYQGLEASLRIEPFSFWRINAQFSAFHQAFEAPKTELILQNNQSTWSARVEQKFLFSDDWQLQLTGRYRAPSIRPQSIRLEQYYFDLGISKPFFNKRLNLSLTLTDAFKTRVFQAVYLGENFRLETSERYQFHRWRLGLKYQIIDHSK